MRVFVASFVEPHAAGQIAESLPTVPGMRPVPPENLHLTLHFLGNLSEPDSASLIRFVDGLGGRSLQVRITAVSGFPSPVKASAVVALLEAKEELEHWHDALAQQWPTGGAGRAFRPHITLGRSRSGVTVPDGETLAGTVIPLLPPRVYESRTDPGGARYLPL
jgi:2'-5' RNA ligase